MSKNGFLIRNILACSLVRSSRDLRGINPAYREEGKQNFSYRLQQLMSQRSNTQFSPLWQGVAKKNYLEN